MARTIAGCPERAGPVASGRVAIRQRGRSRSRRGSQPPAWPTFEASGRPSASAMNRAASRTPSRRDAVLPARRVEEVDEVLRGEVARRRPARRGSRRSRPSDESKQRTPASRPAATLARAVPRVSWKWNAICSSGMPGRDRQRRSASATWRRDADADRVAEADLVDAELEQPERDIDGPMPGRRARCTGSRRRSRRSRGATSRARRRARGPARTRRATRRRVIPMLRVVNASVAAVKTAMRVGAGGLGAGQAAQVRDEDGVADAGRSRRGAAAARRRRRAGGSRVGGDEARRLDLAQAGRRRGAR